MPKTTVHEDDLAARWKYKVGRAWKVRSVKAESVSHPMNE